MGAQGWSLIGLIVVLFLVGGFQLLNCWRNRGKLRSEFDVRGFGFSVKSKASSDTVPGITIEGATSRKGKIAAQDGTGRGVQGADLDARQDIVLINKLPPENNPPKQ